MISSMTGFARQQRSLENDVQLIIEIRSVNHRYLDLALRLPENLHSLETQLRNQLKTKIQRGKIDCTVKLIETETSRKELSLNTALIDTLLKQCASINQSLPNPAPLSALDILRWPCVINTCVLEDRDLQDQVLQLFDFTLNELCATRAREGAALQQCLLDKIQPIRTNIEHIHSRMPELTRAYRHKLLERLAELELDVRSERIEQELVIVAQKIDITEELDRISSHSDEIERILNTGGAAGRRLDFLMQELNREANTLASKSNHIDNTRAAVELKVLIEQMREQIQNIE